MSVDRDQRPGGPADAPEAEPSVLGNLPRSRPTVRSPRRKAATTGAKAGSSQSRPPAEARRPEPRPSTRSSPGPSSSSGPVSELEGLAREGAAAAVGVASLGLRIAGRAATALRDAVERR